MHSCSESSIMRTRWLLIRYYIIAHNAIDLQSCHKVVKQGSLTVGMSDWFCHILLLKNQSEIE